ncbi:MAG: DHA2 family efflux MFS transporter permease subunit [Candidatus Krumholzibacteria bacterium]|nr:DHA2 family efflux MFS transporter permease subunit [Candidatus Krumholzibacteria bacterium]
MALAGNPFSRRTLMEEYPQLRPDHPTYRWLVLAGVMISTFMAVLDATIVNVALSKLMSSFGVSVDKVEWVLTAYLLVFAVMLPTSGWLADHIGYKRVFLAGLLIFTFSSFLCSLAWNLNALILFRVLQGAGAGILMPVGMAIVTREFPAEKRGLALGFWSMAASASVSLGPAIGGYLIEHYSWHAIFDVNVPVGIAGMSAAAIILREHRAEGSRAFDFVGFVSLAAFLTSLLLALSNGNSAWNTGGWHSAYIRTCFAVSIVSLVVFLIVEFSVEHPLIELGLFKNFNFAWSNVLMFLFGFGMFGSTFLLPIYLQNSLGYTALQAGLVFLPVGLLQMIAAPLAGGFADRSSPKIPTILGVTLMAFTFYQFGSLSLFSEHRQIMLPLYLRGIAMGMVLPPLMTLSISEISNKKMAQASGLMNVVRQLGGSFGVAVFGTLLTRRTIYHSAAYGERIDPQSAMFRQIAVRLQSHALQATGGTVADAAAKAKTQLASFVANQAFVRAVDDVFLAAGAVIIIGVIPVLFLRTHRRASSRARVGPKQAHSAMEQDA